MSENKIIPTLWATVYSKTTKRSHLELYYITFTSNDQVKMHTNTLMIFTPHMKKKIREAIRFNLAHGRWLCKVEFCDSTGKDVKGDHHPTVHQPPAGSKP